MTEKITILEETLGQFYYARDETLFKCPFCNHYKKKLSVNLGLNVFKCWICNTKGSIKYLVNRFATKDNRHKWTLLDQSIDMSEGDIFFEPPVVEEIPQVDLPPEYLCLAAKNLPHTAKQPLKYLFNRGVTRRDMVFYKIGFCATGEYRKRIIIPSFNEDGECNYFVARSYGDDWMRYKNPPASRNIVFNELLIDWDSPVVLVEGMFDAIKTENSIPLLGSTLHPRSRLFQKLVMEQTPVYLGLDDDALHKSLKVINSMVEYGLEVYKMNTSDIEDLGAISREEIKSLKEESLPMTFENILNLQWRING